MASLMGLPSEIRTIIILMVMHSTRASPDCLSHHSQRTEADDIRYRSWTRGQGVLYETSRHAPSNSCGLLFANRQLHSETKYLIKVADPPRYELDVMVVGDGELWPTWTCIPFLSTRLRSVTLTFRAFGRYKKQAGMYKEITGQGRRLSWHIYSIVERLLALGPALPAPRPMRPASVVPERRLGIEALTFRVLSNSDELAGSSEVLGQVAESVNSMIRRDSYVHVYATPLYCSVGSISLYHDDNEFRRWELDQILATPVRDTRGTRSDYLLQRQDDGRYGTFEDWRDECIAERVRRGLSVVYPA